jgi:hypothetical protein
VTYSSGVADEAGLETVEGTELVTPDAQLSVLLGKGTYPEAYSGN